MPQPRKSASSARKPAARKPAAKKRAAAGPRRGDGAPEQTDGDAGAAHEAAGREEPLAAALTLLREMLSKGVVITSDRLQETVDEAVRRGRMTRQDAEELVQNLYAIGRRQTQDAIAELEGLVDDTRRQARARARGVSTAARRAPGTDRALRTVDRVRRAAGLGPAFPVIGYDDLTAAQVKDRLEDLDPAQLRKVRDHERRNANRKSVLAAIERRLQ